MILKSKYFEFKIVGLWVACHRGSSGSILIVPSWVFRGPGIFSHGIFLTNFFLVGILWVQ